MRPPRIARWLLCAMAPPALRDEVSEELDAEFLQHALPERGRARATFWYWRQVLASLPRLMRVRDANRGRSGPWLGDVAADLRYGLRQFRYAPLSTAAAVLTLALGLGATTAIFAAAYPALMRPLPYDHPDELVHLFERTPDSDRRSASFPDYFDWRTAPSLQAVAGYSGGTMALTTDASADRVRTIVVTDEFLKVLGVMPQQGRDFAPADMVDGAPRMVIVTHATWQRRFGGRPIIGVPITLNGMAYEVIGVLPERFEFPLRGDGELLVPYIPSAAQLQRRYTHSVDVIARMKPGVRAETLQAELASIGARIAAGDERFHSRSTAHAVPLTDEMIGNLDRLLAGLAASGAIVLVMACANVAMLMLLRMQSRAREISVRSALGASRGRLLRQLFAEALLMSAAAGALALVVARVSVAAATGAIPIRQAVRMPGFRDMGLSIEVVVFLLVLVIAVSVALMMASGWRHTSAPILPSLREDARTSSGGVARRRATALFVGAQVALAMIVLAGAALLLQSVRRLVNVSPGFAVENLLTFRLALTTDHYPTIEAAVVAHDRFLEQFSAIPGVRGAGSITHLPLTGRSNTGSITIDGRTVDGAQPSAAVRTISPGYFRAMGIPLIAGRELNGMDHAVAAHVVLVNRTLARELFQDHAIGERIRFPFLDASWEIVGVVGDERFEDLDRPVMSSVYFAAAQFPSRGFSVVLRTAVDPATLADDVAAVVAAANPRLPVGDLMTMEALRAATGPVWVRRYVLSLVSGFAMLAMLLSAIGVYGVVGQGVADRRREFGIRLALGATAREVTALVVRQGAVPVGVGVAAGLAGALLIQQPLEPFLFRPELRDVAGVAAAAVMLASIAVLACVIPSRRAARTDPAVTLRG